MDPEGKQDGRSKKREEVVKKYRVSTLVLLMKNPFP